MSRAYKIGVDYAPQGEVRMTTARPYSRCARFERFEIDLPAGELRNSGDRVPLQDQPFQILRLLIESAPEVVTREQISSVLWPSDTFVDFDLAINTAAASARGFRRSPKVHSNGGETRI